MLQDVKEVGLLRTDAGWHVGQQDFLAQIVLNHPRHVGIDHLVISDPIAGRISQRDVA